MSTDDRRQMTEVRCKRLSLIFLLSVICSLFSATGCAPTYPKERFNESIIKLCKDEYKLDVKVETIGRTIAIYVPLTDLLDFTFNITNTASEKINDVILSVSRAALSTNARFNFYCIIAHDVRIPEIQIVIIKSVDDVKRFLLNDISRGEYSKRMLIDMRLNPQSQKENAIKNVFEKMSLDPKWQEEVMNDFFRSEPAGLGDIGYWNGRFYIKDISLPEFLAEQIANRVKLEFREDKKLSQDILIKSAKGLYFSGEGKRYFRLEILPSYRWSNDLEGRDISDKLFQGALRIAGHIVHAYKFGDFDYVEIINQADNKILKVAAEELEGLRVKKIKPEEILSRV